MIKWSILQYWLRYKIRNISQLHDLFLTICITACFWGFHRRTTTSVTIKRGIFRNIRCLIHKIFVRSPALQFKVTCSIEGNNISDVFLTITPGDNWIIRIKNNLPCTLLDFSYRRFGSVLLRRARLRIFWDDSKLLEESLEKSLLEVLMIIIVQCRWEAKKFNESPKGILSFWWSFIWAWKECLESKFVGIQSF